VPLIQWSQTVTGQALRPSAKDRARPASMWLNLLTLEPMEGQRVLPARKGNSLLKCLLLISLDY